MNRPLFIALVAGVCFAITANADNKLPPAVKPILDKAVRDVKKNRDEFVKANKEPLRVARDALKELATKLIADGKSMEAQAVLKKVDTLDADVLKLADAPAPAPDPSPAPQKPLLERLAGRWYRPNDAINYWVIDGGGNAGCRKGADNIPCHADAKAIVVDDETAEIAWPTGIKWRIKMAGNDVLAVDETGLDGKSVSDGVVLTRKK